MEIQISKSDVAWNYFAQIFNLSFGLITLPLILKLLNPDEIGFNYILMSISSIVVLFDLGFSSQFSRYLTYIFSGSQTLEKDGLSSEYSDQMNEHLLAVTVTASKRTYFFMSFVALISLITVGSYYVLCVIKGVDTIPNLYIVWGVFCLSSYFNMYYSYYGVFLESKGLIKERNKAQIISKLAYVVIVVALLLLNFGLLAVVIANLLSPFIFRILANKIFFTGDVKRIIGENKVTRKEVWDIFIKLLYNAKKLGIITVLSSIITYSTTLVIGMFLPLSDVASYGLMAQIVGIITIGATLFFRTYSSRFASLLARHEFEKLKIAFGLSMFFFFLVSLIGMFIILIVPQLIDYFSFNAKLPGLLILLSFYIYKVLEQNQSLFTQLFLFSNDMRFYPSAVATGLSSFTCLLLLLYLGCGLIGVVIAQSVPLYLYVAWYWPWKAMKTFNITHKDLFCVPAKTIKDYVWKRYF